MAAIETMAYSIHEWMTKNALGVAGYVGSSTVLAGITPAQITKLGAIVNTLTNINIIVAFLVGLVTFIIKAIELWDKIKTRRKQRQDEANRDSSELDTP